MAVNHYTNIVLTVIAAALLWICAFLSGAPVRAQQLAPAPLQMLQGKPQPVVIVGWGTATPQGEVSLSMVTEGDGRVHTDSGLPVKVHQMPPQPLAVSLSYTPQNPLPVEITGIKPVTAWEPVRTKEEPMTPKKTPGN